MSDLAWMIDCMQLGGAHSSPIRLCFLDETGVVAQDRYFAVGVLAIPESSPLPREVRKLRQRRGWFDEFHFSGLSPSGLVVYRALIDLLAEADDWEFRLCIADRDTFDVAEALVDRFLAYERIAAQCLSSILHPHFASVVLADEYVTPDDVAFEVDVRRVVNARANANAIAGVVRVHSHGHDLLQVSDVLTGALTYPMRRTTVRPAGKRPSVKHRLSTYVETTLRGRFVVEPFEQSWASSGTK